MIHIICILITIVFLYLIYRQVNETFESANNTTTGDQGDLGDQGIKGIAGAKGAKGVPGDPGANLALTSLGITFDSSKDQLNFPTNLCVGSECLGSIDVANMKKFYNKCKFFLWDPPNTYRDYSSTWNNFEETKDGKWKRDSPTTTERRWWSYGLLEAKHSASHAAASDFTTFFHTIKTESKISQRLIGVKITCQREDDPDWGKFYNVIRNCCFMIMPTDNYKNMLLAAAYLINLDTNQTGFTSIYDKAGNAPDKSKFTDNAITDAAIYLKSLDSTTYALETKRVYNTLGETPVEPVAGDPIATKPYRGKVYVGTHGAFEVFFPRIVECKYIKMYLVKGLDPMSENSGTGHQMGIYLCL